MRRILYVFDWDGTLIDSVGRIVGCLRRAAEDLGLHGHDDSTFGDVIGLGLPQAIERLYPGLDLERAESFRARYAAHFLSADAEPSGFFPGALEVLEELRRRGHLLAVATGKSRRGLDRVLAQKGMDGYFDATRCADETASKPHPRMLREIFEELGARPRDSVMVGDTEYDMEMARRAGARGVGVSYGVHAPTRLAAHAPELIVDSLAELLHYRPGESPPEHPDADLFEEIRQ